VNVIVFANGFPARSFTHSLSKIRLYFVLAANNADVYWLGLCATQLFKPKNMKNVTIQFLNI
jgi:hypothetical protein